MAAPSVALNLNVNTSSWGRWMSQAKRDLSDLRTPRQMLRGMFGAGAVGIGAVAAFAARPFVRAPQDIMDAHRAAQISEGRLNEGELWDLMLKERKELIPGVLSGEASNIASIMHAAERFDPTAMEYRSRFLGGETDDVAAAMRTLFQRYEDASGPIKQEMRAIFPALVNEVARANAEEFIKNWGDIAKQEDMQRVADTALGVYRAKRWAEEGIITKAAGAVGAGAANVERNAKEWWDEVSNIPRDVKEGLDETFRRLHDWEVNAPVNKELREDIKSLIDNLQKVFGAQEWSRGVEEGTRRAMDN